MGADALVQIIVEADWEAFLESLHLPEEYLDPRGEWISPPGQILERRVFDLAAIAAPPVFGEDDWEQEEQWKIDHWGSSEGAFLGRAYDFFGELFLLCLWEGVEFSEGSRELDGLVSLLNALTARWEFSVRCLFHSPETGISGEIEGGHGDVSLRLVAEADEDDSFGDGGRAAEIAEMLTSRWERDVMLAMDWFNEDRWPRRPR